MSNVNRSRGERFRSSAKYTHALLIRAYPPSTELSAVERSLSELAQLVEGLGIEVTERIVQARAVTGAPGYFGEGKLRELAKLTGGPGESMRGPTNAVVPPREDGLVVVVDDELTPAQQRNLELALACDVLDRTAVILRVFEARAGTHEAQLEVELARLTYELPRVRDDHSLGDREGGGGRASRGHTNVELKKQRLREQMAELREKLSELTRTDERRRAARSDALRCALVGYTNAGKSSLMRALTGASVLVEDKLFATLTTTVRKLVPPARPPVLVADTVGFIDRLPHALVASFRATLAESLTADLLLLVADASDPHFREHIRVCGETLEGIGARRQDIRIVLNKLDRLEPTQRNALAAEFPRAVLVSAHHPADVARLRARIDALLNARLVTKTLTIPYPQMSVLAQLRNQIEVLHEEYGDALTVSLRATDATLAMLEARLKASG